MSYYSRHRDKVLEYQKQYREENKEKIQDGKARYRTDPANKDKEKAYAKQYREAHKDYINEKLRCSNCGATISRNGMARHRESKKCKGT